MEGQKKKKVDCKERGGQGKSTFKPNIGNHDKGKKCFVVDREEKIPELQAETDAWGGGPEEKKNCTQWREGQSAGEGGDEPERKWASWGD